MNKKQAAAAVLALAAVLTAAYHAPVQGPWLDRQVAAALNHSTGLRWDCQKTRLSRLSRLSFETIGVRSNDGRLLVSAGPGSIRADRPFFLAPQHSVLSAANPRLETGAIPGADTPAAGLDRIEIVLERRDQKNSVVVTVYSASKPRFQAQWQ